jgi:hypothetical protein
MDIRTEYRQGATEAEAIESLLEQVADLQNELVTAD